MLHYPVYPPLSSQVPKKSLVKDNSDHFRHHESPPSSAGLNARSSQRTQQKDFSRLPLSAPLSIATNLNSSPTFSSSPSSSSSKPLRSPYIAPTRRSPSNVSISDNNKFPWSSFSPAQSRAPSTPSIVSSTLEDVFAPGDIFGQGTTLQGETIKVVSPPNAPAWEAEPAREFEVVRRLGTGSYAVVYLVCEVLSRPPSADNMSLVESMDLQVKTRSSHIQYGREYAIKCLSKANLDEDALAAQMSEVTIHQSLCSHPNIVTHHRTLETSSFLLLLLEFVPGEDLFYFLEQARDHYENENDSSNSADSSCSSRTPPTPSLLSNLNPSHQLSRTRLRLISSMFSQMCDAVAACHDQQVFHRDIKPENFIVTDGWTTAPDGRQERKVFVKLTDFGLSTTDIESSDMDCGSAPYMSYECRNNLAPTYRPRAADVWSLGIVLINMLYHCNPWTDTAEDACSSFSLYLRDPVNFFMNRFTGMTRAVAEVLSNHVFNILEDEDDNKRFTASAFGAWIKDLPDLLAPPLQQSAPRGHQRTISVASATQGYPISSSTPISHRPTSRQVSIAGSTHVRTPIITTRSLSRPPSVTAPVSHHIEVSELSTVIDQEEKENEIEEEEEDLTPAGMTSRSTSTGKRRKRGARKGKGPASIKDAKPDDTLTTLAIASQSLAREISLASKASGSTHKPSSIKSSSTKGSKATSDSRRSAPREPPSMYAVPTALCTPPKGPPRSISTASTLSKEKRSAAPTAYIPPVPPLPSSVPVKKPSKWKLSFGKAHAASVSPTTEDAVSIDANAAMSTTASNVTTLIMGLSAPTPRTPAVSSADEASSWRRGRRGDRDRETIHTHTTKSGGRSPLPSYMMSSTDDLSTDSQSSKNSGRPIVSSATSVASSNWRSSMSTSSSAASSSAGTSSSSAFTKYSNSSTRSVSTAATSLSSTSWRTNAKPSSPHPTHNQTYSGPPKNIKIMDGVPWELFELPRGQRPEPMGDLFGTGPPTPGGRKQRSRKPKENMNHAATGSGAGLGTISERSPSEKGMGQRCDASTSTSDLNGMVSGDVSGGPGIVGYGGEDRPSKALQKQQINALSKMLSALRR